MFLWYFSIFLVCCTAFYYAGENAVNGLRRISKFLGIKDFITAFFVMAAASSFPNLFVGITSALRGVSQLSFGDVFGNNLACLTLVAAFGAFFSRSGIGTRSKITQRSIFFMVLSALLPLLLVADGILGRVDGLILLIFFIYYIFWLFSKERRFSTFSDQELLSENPLERLRFFLQDILKLLTALIIFIVAAQGVVISARFFAQKLNFPLVLMGVMFTGFGSALPEIYFSVSSAKKGKIESIIGDLIGAVIIPSTFVLGVVSLISPIRISDFSFLINARIFLLIAAVFFLISAKTDNKITKKEGFFLVLIYILFILTEIYLARIII